MHLNDLRSKKIDELIKTAQELEIENVTNLKRHEIIFSNWVFSVILQKTIKFLLKNCLCDKVYSYKTISYELRAK